MASEVSAETTAYDELGAHRHLVVSERLRIRRRSLGLTQKEVVARLRRLGVVTTNKSLSSLEHGAGLDVGKLPELACALDCTLTYLVGLTDDPSQWEPDGRLWPSRSSNGGPDPTAPNTPTVVAQRKPEVGPPSPPCPAILGPLDPPRRR